VGSWIDFRAAVYGTISVGALLAAESADQETYLATVGAVTLTLLLYVLIHSYSEFSAERLAASEPLEFEELGRTIARESWLLVGAGVPLVALLLCWVLGATLSTAVTVAVWTSAVMVLLLELISGLRAGATGRDLAFQIGIGALFGTLVIALRIVLH
jgi:NADH:ubiquinone oxidoreductase subunit 6 (subunit J)